MLTCLILATLAGQPDTFQLAAKSIGTPIDLHADERVKTKKSERTGHASFTKAELDKALKLLAPDQRKAYTTVRAKLAGHPEAEQLDALAAKHRLGYRDAHGHTVLDNLALLVTHLPKHNISNVRLACDLVSDLTRPSTIFQAQHNTCSATSTQSALARKRPGEYARVVTELGLLDQSRTESGAYVLKGSGFIAFPDRTASSNLMQPAIMELEATVEQGHYHNKEDLTYPAKGQPHAGGKVSGICLAEEQLLGGKYAMLLTTNPDKATRAKQLDQGMKLLRKASAENPYLICIDIKDRRGDLGPHEVQCVKYDKAKHTITVRNPWAEYHEIPADAVKAALEAVNYPQ